MRRRRFLAGTVPVATSGLAGCIGEDFDDGADPDDDTGTDTPDADGGTDTEAEGPPARVVESELVRENQGTEEESVAVEGVVERTRDEEITYLEVRVEFLDEEEEVLASTIEHLDDVTEGDRWEFVVEFPGVGEAAARVADHSASIVENP